MTEPSLEDFLAPSPAPRKSKRILISVVAGLLVLALVGGFIVFAFNWGNDDERPVQTSQVADSPIAAAAQRYVAAASGGIAADYLGAMCQQMTSQYQGITDQAPSATQMVVRSVTDVVIDGATATAMVSIAPSNSPDAIPRENKLLFVDEGGWKFCGEAQ